MCYTCLSNIVVCWHIDICSFKFWLRVISQINDKVTGYNKCFVFFFSLNTWSIVAVYRNLGFVIKAILTPWLYGLCCHCQLKLLIALYRDECLWFENISINSRPCWASNGALLSKIFEDTTVSQAWWWTWGRRIAVSLKPHIFRAVCAFLSYRVWQRWQHGGERLSSRGAQGHGG